MRQYEILDAQGMVINTIVADNEEFVVAHFGAGRWRAVQPQPDQPAAAAPRHVTKLAFRNRFTAAEKVGIEIAAIDDPTATAARRQQAAALRVNQADQRDAIYIDLDRPATRAGVQQLESVGLIAAGRAAQILDTPIEPHEAYTT
jgi:hypothetical protein